MNKTNNNALFDPIINSEDEMIRNAGLQNARFHAYTYLRAYIMATLCFTKELVVTDTAVNLNRAFRTLIDKDEDNGYYFDEEKKYLLYPADFSWLIKNGHITIAARDTFTNFSDLLDEQKEKKHVDLPSIEYVKKIDEICQNEKIRKYSKDDAFINFSSSCRYEINKELNNINVFPEREKILKELIYRLADKKTFTYSDVKDILLSDMKLNEKNPEYEFIHGILRHSYDYKIPNLLGLDCCMSLRDMRPSRSQDWKLDLSCKELKRDFSCSVYGLASLPAQSLLDIWGSDAGINFFQQLDQFRGDGDFELNEYVELLNNYLLKINDVVKNNYSDKFIHESRAKRFEVKFRKYFKTDSKLFVVAKIGSNIYTGVNYMRNFDSLIWDTIMCKLIPCMTKRIDVFPDPPEDMKEAVMLKSRSEKDNTCRKFSILISS